MPRVEWSLPLLHHPDGSARRYHSPTEGQRIGNQLDAAFIFARANFVNVL
jgi:hypothetical protein